MAETLIVELPSGISITLSMQSNLSVELGLTLPGPPGPQGEQGPQGNQGVPGQDGYTPVKGVDYFDGTDGANGLNGQDGASAYQIAVAGGFVGTEAEWLASLKGPQGEPGRDGTGTGDMMAADWDPDGDGKFEINKVNGLQAALDGKSNTGHGHAISDVTGLQDAIDAKAAPATQTTVTILSSAWTGAAAPYTATLTVSGITATTKGDIGLADTATATQREAARNAMISVSGLGAGTISLVVDGEKPIIDIPAVVTVLG